MINKNNVGHIINEDHALGRAVASCHSKIAQFHCLVDGSRFNIFKKLNNSKRTHDLDACII